MTPRQYKSLLIHNLSSALSYEEYSAVATLINEAVTTDGDHHKQWHFEQIAKVLNILLPEHDEGIAP